MIGVKPLQSSALHSLVLLVTLRCPLECDHCIVESSPRRTERIELAELKEIIAEAASLGLRTVGFTGGEPLLYPNEVTELHEFARSLNIKTLLITSAFFAKTVESAINVLKPFQELHMLGLSTDSYHQSFTSTEFIQNAIVAARQVGIKKIEVQVSHLSNTGELNKVHEWMREYSKHVTLREQVVWPVGRASRLLEMASDSLKPIEDLNLDCPMVGPVVTPDRNLHACCSALLNLGERNPLILGNLNNSALKVIWENAQQNSYYQLVKRGGLGPLIQLLTRLGLDDELEGRYTDVCHLCHDIQSRPNLVSPLREAADILSRLDEANQSLQLADERRET